MSKNDFPENVRQFIFDYIHSAEQLEILLFLRRHSDEWWSIQAISNELRSSTPSVSQRLELLIDSAIIIEKSGQYKINTTNPKFIETIEQLNDTYKIKKQKTLELIFSPLKKAKDFADAFILNKNSKKGD